MTTASALEREMLNLINGERASRGLDPLKLELNLNQSAEDHSEWMLAADTFSHTGAGGSSATQRMDAAGFDFSGSWRSGENIGFQSERGAPGVSDDVAAIHQALMNSSGHRANILNARFDYVGLGIEIGDYKGYNVVMVTQNFAATQGSVDLDGGSAPVVPPVAAPSAPPQTGPNEITGTSGSNTLTGTGGDDLIDGQGGKDNLRGRAGDDELRGGSGDDKLNGGSGRDALIGGSGKDRAEYKDASSGVRADLQNSGVNSGEAAGDTYSSIERLLGSGHGDRLSGDGGNNKIWGGNGADRIEGRGGNDTLKGGSGRDTLDGGSGNDSLTGGRGVDTFVYGEGDGRDRVLDFQDDRDVLDLRDLDLTRSELSAKASQVGDDVVLNFGSGRLTVENMTISELQNDLLL